MKRSAMNRPRSTGFSLIELLVAMAIGLIITLAVTTVMVRSEGLKRGVTSTNDVNQTGTYISYVLDREIRSAGSGFSQRWNDVFGCELRAQRDGVALWPRANPLPDPFASVAFTAALPLRMAPILINKSASASGSDVLMVMSGTSGFGETASSILTGSVTANDLRVPNTLGVRANDLVLLAENGVGCTLQQVNAAFVESGSQTLPFGGRYYTANGLAAFGTSTSSFLVPLGTGPSPTLPATNPPQFRLIGVGADNTLFSYDLLWSGNDDASQAIADGVVEMRALYGVDTNGDRSVDAWMDPGASPWTFKELNSASGAPNVRNILSIRVGLILSTSLPERDPVAKAEWVLFKDTAAPQTRTLTKDEQNRRHSSIEFTVPLRNMLLVP